MSKKIGQVGVGFLAIFVLLGLLFISFEILSSRTNIFIATARETKIIEGIDKVEFTKSGLIEALEYSYTQAAFDVGNRGGFVELDDIESFSCTPYFRLFQDTNKPNEKESMERLMSKYFNEYSIELSGEVVTPAYTNFQISSDEENSIVQGFGASPILLNRQNVKIEDISDVETMVLTRLHKMYAEAKLLFIDGTPGLDGIVRDALQHRIRLADGSMPHEPGLSDDDYKSQNIGSVCEGQQRPAWVLLTRKQEAGKTNPTLCNGKIDPRLCYENNVREQLQRLEDDIEKTFDNEVDVTIDLTTLEGINLVKEYDEFKDINPEETGSSSWHTRIRIDATCNPSRVVPDLNCGCNNWQEREVPVTDEEGNIVLDGNGRPLMTTEKYCEPKDYKNRWDDVICDYFYNTVVVVKVKMEDKKYEYPVWNAETKEVEMKPLSFEFYATNGESKDIGEIYSLSEFKDKITNVCEEPVIEEPIEPPEIEPVLGPRPKFSLDGYACNERGIVTPQEGGLNLNGKPFKFIGVNAFYLGLSDISDAEIENSLSYLANSCGVSGVRVWGFKDIGIDNIRRVLDIGAKYNLKFVIALDNPIGDYTGTKIDTQWYKEGYKNEFKPYVEGLVRTIKQTHNEEILAWEILNEPHCGYPLANGQECIDAFDNFLKDMSNTIKTVDPDHMVSTGVIGLDQPGASAVDGSFKTIHDIDSITSATAHYYWGSPCARSDGFNCIMRDVETANSLDKPFYLGELGDVVGVEQTCTIQCGEDCDKRVQNLNSVIYDTMNSGADGFLIWQYSIKGKPYCDTYSFFGGDPICSYLKSVADSCEEK